MRITIYLNLKKCSPLYRDALNEYIKRISAFADLQVVFRKKCISFPATKKDTFNIVVSCGTDSPSSEGLADMINSITLSGCSNINFILLSREENDPLDDCKLHKAEYDAHISLSSFDIPADLSAVIMAEQIYRAFCINNNITYHK